jgi:RNA polymerase sigma-70 factor (ECF subfamily)
MGQSEDGQRVSPGWDRAAFAGLVREHGPAIHAYLARRAGRQVADDLFSEVWLRAWRGRDSYDPCVGAVLPWLIGIARNSLRGHSHLEVPNFARLFELHCDPWPDTDDRLDATRVATALGRALGRLTHPYREILLLAVWEQLPPAEIAHALQIHPGTVRSRLYRARNALREYLEDELEVRFGSDVQEVCW